MQSAFSLLIALGGADLVLAGVTCQGWCLEQSNKLGEEVQGRWFGGSTEDGDIGDGRLQLVFCRNARVEAGGLHLGNRELQLSYKWKLFCVHVLVSAFILRWPPMIFLFGVILKIQWEIQFNIRPLVKIYSYPILTIQKILYNIEI